ncbi:phytochrome kinase substrate-related family protein [Striga asiatica]|uniref:Phytochrome kinase substrate-related family protein n=1 Tax=Striga asiatica TaxID=4170 RepID=A0A5A7R2I5_STRAF|nr:phytochrome kinase substrate-related family protein [Striga asiatica]
MDPPPPPPPPPAVAVVPKPLRYNSSQHNPVFKATASDKSPLNFQSFSLSKNPNYDDLSFSSYVKPKDNDDEEPEISIFDAHKYFCETNDIKNNNNNNNIQDPRLSSVSSEGYGRNFRTRSFNATPTASSEASWNSQTGLLANPPGSAAVTVKNLATSGDHGLQRKSSGKKWIFGRKCCCTGKKSVRVKEATVGPVETKNGPRVKGGDVVRHVAAPDPPLPRQQRISASGRAFVDGSGGFSFPVLKNPTQTVRGIRPVEEDPPRDSLEVFQPAGIGGGRHLFKPGSPIGRMVVASTDDDMGSDASSDLFELESFSTQTTSYPMYRRRDSLDEAQIFGARRLGGGDRRIVDEEAPATPSVAATECYAPSEVSVDWSVTTAEGFDRASLSEVAPNKAFRLAY